MNAMVNIGIGLQGDDSLVYDFSQFVVPANSQDQVAQLKAPSYQLPSVPRMMYVTFQ